MPTRFVTLIFCAFIFSSALGNSNIDSLLLQLSVCSDTSCYRILTQLADAYYFDSQVELAASYYKKAAELAEQDQQPNLRHVSESYGNLGLCIYELGRYPEAISLYKKALAAASKSYDSTEIATQYSNMGVAYFLMGNYEQSIDHYQKALAIDKVLDTKETIGVDYSVIGNVFATWGKHENAKSFFRNSLKIAKEVNNLDLITGRLNKLASSCIALQQYDSALIFLNESLTMAKDLKNISRTALILNQIGFTYQKSERYDMAEKFYNEALGFAEQSIDIRTEIVLYSNIGENYISLNNLALAEDYCTKSLSKALKIGLVGSVLKNYELLATIDQAKGNFKEAFQYSQLHASLKDSLFTAESQKKLAEFQVIHETEEKENEIRLLNSEKLIQEVQIKRATQRFYFFIAITALLLILIGLVYYQYVSRKKINKMLTEKNEQLNLLNSTKDRFISIIAHDLKNPFSAFYNISSSLFHKKALLTKPEQDRLIESIYLSSEKLRDLLYSLLDWAKLQRDNLTFSKEPLNVREIVQTSISLNSGISQSKNIVVLNDVQENVIIESDKNTVLAVINNLLTNAVKFSPRNETVVLTSNIDHNHLDLVVKDKGIGMTKDEISQLFRIDVDTRKIGNSSEKGTGMGLILCKELLQKVQGNIRVESEKDKGSKFIVTLPIK